MALHKQNTNHDFFICGGELQVMDERVDRIFVGLALVCGQVVLVHPPSYSSRCERSVLKALDTPHATTTSDTTLSVEQTQQFKQRACSVERSAPLSARQLHELIITTMRAYSGTNKLYSFNLNRYIRQDKLQFEYQEITMRNTNSLF